MFFSCDSGGLSNIIRCNMLLCHRLGSELPGQYHRGPAVLPERSGFWMKRKLPRAKNLPCATRERLFDKELQQNSCNTGRVYFYMPFILANHSYICPRSFWNIGDLLRCPGLGPYPDQTTLCCSGGRVLRLPRECSLSNFRLRFFCGSN